jgi:hypothetical protein
MRRISAILALIAAVLTAAPALAEKAGDPGTNVEMPFLIAPLSVDGKLYGYAYVSLKIVTTTQGAALQVRDKVAFIQDAFVRDVNAVSIGLPKDPKTVDKAALVVRLLADAKRVIGAAKIASVVLIQVQISPIHPGEAVAANPAG